MDSKIGPSLDALSASDLQGKGNLELARLGVAVPGSPLWNAPEQIALRARLKKEQDAGKGQVLPPPPAPQDTTQGPDQNARTARSPLTPDNTASQPADYASARNAGGAQYNVQDYGDVPQPAQLAPDQGGDATTTDQSAPPSPSGLGLVVVALLVFFLFRGGR